VPAAAERSGAMPILDAGAIGPPALVMLTPIECWGAQPVLEARAKLARARAPPRPGRTPLFLLHGALLN
jgi:hypothetical protein